MKLQQTNSFALHAFMNSNWNQSIEIDLTKIEHYFSARQTNKSKLNIDEMPVGLAKWPKHKRNHLTIDPKNPRILNLTSGLTCLLACLRLHFMWITLMTALIISRLSLQSSNWQCKQIDVFYMNYNFANLQRRTRIPSSWNQKVKQQSENSSCSTLIVMAMKMTGTKVPFVELHTW